MHKDSSEDYLSIPLASCLAKVIKPLFEYTRKARLSRVKLESQEHDSTCTLEVTLREKLATLGDEWTAIYSYFS